MFTQSAACTLPRAGMVAQVVEEKTGEVQYTLRVAGDRFTPGVAKPGSYRVRWQDERTGRWQNESAARQAT